MDSAPRTGLALDSAANCMACSGPQGIRPLSSPTVSGARGRSRFGRRGRRSRSLRRAGNSPSRFSPIASINSPATTLSAACASTDSEVSSPAPNSMPSVPKISPVRV